jgi:hypothetical protein
MQIKKALRYSSESHAVAEDVKRHFKDRLPAEWGDLVHAACYPGLLEQPDLHGYIDCWSDGTIAGVPMCKGIENFLQCFARDPDLTLEVMSYARQCCARRDPSRVRKKAAIVRAALVRSWRAILVEQNGEWRSPTVGEAQRLLDPKSPRRLRVAEVCDLYDKEIADWLTRKYGLRVTKDDVEKARDAISKPASSRKGGGKTRR